MEKDKTLKMKSKIIFTILFSRHKKTIYDLKSNKKPQEKPINNKNRIMVGWFSVS